MNVTLRVWRQKDAHSAGRFVEYEAKDINPNMSFLEMLDVVNEELTRRGEEPIAFDHDCREGICGMCSCVINGEPHGPEYKVATCQTYLRSFRDGETITVEPFRARGIPAHQGPDCRPDRVRSRHSSRRLYLSLDGVRS